MEIRQTSREEFGKIGTLSNDNKELEDEEVVVKVKELRKGQRKTIQLSKVENWINEKFYCMRSLKELKK